MKNLSIPSPISYTTCTRPLRRDLPRLHRQAWRGEHSSSPAPFLTLNTNTHSAGQWQTPTSAFLLLYHPDVSFFGHSCHLLLFKSRRTDSDYDTITLTLFSEVKQRKLHHSVDTTTTMKCVWQGLFVCFNWVYRLSFCYLWFLLLFVCVQKCVLYFGDCQSLQENGPLQLIWLCNCRTPLSLI